MDGLYCAKYQCATICQAWADSQQKPCAGYEHSPTKRKCRYWHDLGDGMYHCSNMDAQLWARRTPRREGDAK